MPTPPNEVQEPPTGIDFGGVVRQLVQALGSLEHQLAIDGVSTLVDPGSVRAHLASRYDLEHAHPIGELACDVFNTLYKGIVHPNHPRHFGLFVPAVGSAGVVLVVRASGLRDRSVRA